MLAIIVCAVLLVAIGYFAALCGAEVLWWVRDSIQGNKPVQPQTSPLPRRQIITR